MGKSSWSESTFKLCVQLDVHAIVKVGPQLINDDDDDDDDDDDADDDDDGDMSKNNI